MPGVFFDTLERMHEGSRVKERDFDLGIARQSKELAQEYVAQAGQRDRPEVPGEVRAH